MKDSGFLSAISVDSNRHLAWGAKMNFVIPSRDPATTPKTKYEKEIQYSLLNLGPNTSVVAASLRMGNNIKMAKRTSHRDRLGLNSRQTLYTWKVVHTYYIGSNLLEFSWFLILLSNFDKWLKYFSHSMVSRIFENFCTKREIPAQTVFHPVYFRFR